MRVRLLALAAVMAATALATAVAPAGPARAGVQAPTGLQWFARVPAANIGDSFASGYGGIPYEPGSYNSHDRCARSLSSAFKLLTYSGFLSARVDAACAGATTSNIYAHGEFGEPPQAAQLAANHQVLRYFVTVGGDDIGFTKLFACFVTSNCQFTSVPKQAYLAAIHLGPALSRAYAALKRAAPQARGVAVLYPPLLPPDAPNPSLRDCPYINTLELSLGDSIEAALNHVIAVTARAYGFIVVNPGPRFAGHSLCAGGLRTYFYRPFAYGGGHPNLRGRIALARAEAAQVP